MAVPSTPAQVTPQQMIAAQMAYGPNAGLAFQRSQYLAQALQSLQQNAQDNIRTPGALWSNLAADALMQWGKHKADQQAMGAYQQDQANLRHKLFDGTPGDPNSGPPAVAAAPAPPPAPDAAPTPQGSPALASALQSQPVDQIDPAKLHLAQMVWGEARGEPPEGQQAVAAVALNRAKQSGKPLDEVLAAPHQFSGYNARSQAVPPDQLASILANIQPALNGQDPTNGADHFFNPALASPSWGAGPGQTIGQHKFMALNGPVPQPPLQGGAGADTLPPPSPAPSPPGPAPAPAPAQPPAGAGAPSPQAPQQPPTGYVSPQEWQYARQLFDDPRTRPQGIELALKLRLQSMTPVEMKPGTYWGKDGQAHSVEQFIDQPGSPNAFTQRSSLDNSIHTQPNAAYGPVAGGMHMNNNGSVSPVPVQQKPTFRIPGAPGVYVTDANGNPTKVADDNYTVKDVGSTMQELTSSQQYDKAAKLTEMYRGAVQAASRPGGISDAELKDNAAQIFSGGVARQFNAKMLDEGQGPWLRLKQVFPEIASGQKLSPQARQAMVQAMHDYAVEAQTAFGGLAQSKSAYASQNGVDLSPFIKPLMQPLPDVPDISGIPTGISGYNTGAPNPANAQATAIQAEIARRKAAGTWTGR